MEDFPSVSTNMELANTKYILFLDDLEKGFARDDDTQLVCMPAYVPSEHFMINKKTLLITVSGRKFC
jgi:hypothetical protein